MSIDTLKGLTVDAKLWIKTSEVRSKALDQLRNIASLPWVRHVAVMPDCHFGIGATVGSVIGMKGAISPAAVGVDIGCGMAAMKTSLTASDLPDSLKEIRSAVEAAIPVGFNRHTSVTPVVTDLPLWKEWAGLDQQVATNERRDRALTQVGTLGGGNHFIELCLDEKQNVWMMLHSGSRNIGKELAEKHITVAKELIHNIRLPDRDLAVFLAATPEMKAYRTDLYWAQQYAFENRQHMLRLYKKALRSFFPQMVCEHPILCHHNYVSEEIHFGEELFVTRKGAIRALEGQLGIIPGSMGTHSYIVRGKGNAESLCSASHGAGRRMSRGEAKRTFTEADLVIQTTGVECRKDVGVLDEIPGAYKDIDQVMANQGDLVEIVTTLKQVMCVKG